MYMDLTDIRKAIQVKRDQLTKPLPVSAYNLVGRLTPRESTANKGNDGERL